MQYHNLSHVESGQSLQTKSHLHRQKVYRLRESIHNHPNRVMSTPGKRNPGDKIHRDVLPLPLGNGKWSKLARSRRCSTFTRRHVKHRATNSSNLSLNAPPPKMLLHVLVHLGGTGMNAQPRVMCIRQQILLQLNITENADPPPKS
ncbi:hypothetical protein Dimus_038414 [Dionaea muscipula]